MFIVYAHHEPKSFNGAMLAEAQRFFTERGDGVIVSSLYEMGFNPVSDRRNFLQTKNADYLKQQQEELHASENSSFAPGLDAEMAKLEACDVFIMQFPLWWFGLPGILKGWVDRVFAMGRIYGGGKWYDEGVFKGKRAMLALTTGGPPTMYSPEGLNGDIDMILYPINHGILRFTGFDVVPPFIVYGPARMTDEQRSQELANYRARLEALSTIEPIAYPRLSEFDAATWTRKAG